MRRFSGTIILLAASAALTPALALRSSDTMQAWKKASAKERADIVDELLGKGPGGTDRAAVLECLDEASRVSGHGDIEIGDVVRGCRSMDKSSEPI